MSDPYAAGDPVKDEEILMHHQQPFCTKRRFQIVTFGSILVTIVSLCIVVPVVVIQSKNKVKASESIRYGTAWMPLGDKLLADVGGQEFGESVDLSAGGDFLSIGSNKKGEGNKGQVEVRQYSGLSWRLLGKTIAGSKAGENFGHSVQISEKGKIVVAGGFGSDSFDDENLVKGVVRAYELNEREQKWEQFGSAVYGDEAGDRFAVALSASDDGLSWIVGADNARGPGDERNGYAKVYTLRGDDWALKGNPIPGLNGERTGYAVAMSGDGETVCVGDRWYKVPDVGKRGRARCFTYNGNDWSKKGEDIVGTHDNAEMGYSLALNYDGNRVAVGNRYAGDDRQGSITVFQHSGKRWKMMGEEQTSVRRNDQSGFKVSLNKEGNVVAWTARGYNGDGNDTGVVRVARWIDGQWKRLGSDLLGDEAKDYFGESVALNADGTIVAASANWGDVEYVRAFALN